jgi:hypothetical protein
MFMGKFDLDPRFREDDCNGVNNVHGIAVNCM